MADHLDITLTQAEEDEMIRSIQNERTISPDQNEVKKPLRWIDNEVKATPVQNKVKTTFIQNEVKMTSRDQNEVKMQQKVTSSNQNELKMLQKMTSRNQNEVKMLQKMISRNQNEVKMTSRTQNEVKMGGKSSKSLAEPCQNFEILPNQNEVKMTSRTQNEVKIQFSQDNVKTLPDGLDRIHGWQRSNSLAEPCQNFEIPSITNEDDDGTLYTQDMDEYKTSGLGTKSPELSQGSITNLVSEEEDSDSVVFMGMNAHPDSVLHEALAQRGPPALIQRLTTTGEPVKGILKNGGQSKSLAEVVSAHQPTWDKGRSFERNTPTPPHGDEVTWIGIDTLNENSTMAALGQAKPKPLPRPRTTRMYDGKKRKEKREATHQLGGAITREMIEKNDLYSTR